MNGGLRFEMLGSYGVGLRGDVKPMGSGLVLLKDGEIVVRAVINKNKPGYYCDIVRGTGNRDVRWRGPIPGSY